MPKRAAKLTKRELDKLLDDAQADPSLVKTMADAGQAGLYVQARRGKVWFIFRYGPVGARQSLFIDFYGSGLTLEQARNIAGEHRATVKGGKNPKEERAAEKDQRAEEKRRRTTVAVAVESYLADLQHRAETGTGKRGKPSGYETAKRLLRNKVVKNEAVPLGNLGLVDVTADKVRELHRSMRRTPVEANRVLVFLSAVFNFAATEKGGNLVTGNPVRDVLKNERYREEGKRRALSREELTALGKALREAEESGSVPKVEKGKTVRLQVDPAAVLAIRFLALTGFRRSELLGHPMKGRRSDRHGLRWADVDPAAARVYLHDSKAGRQERVIGAAAVELLREARPEARRGQDVNALRVCPMVQIDKARRAIFEAAGIVTTAAGRADLHSLRHSFASIGAHLQHGRYVGAVSPLLGHGHQTKRTITERYITDDLEALRPAADAISAEIARLLGIGTPAEVIAFPAREQVGP